VQRLQPLGRVERVESRGHVHGDVVAADGDRVGMNELAFRKHRNRRRAAAHVDAGAPISSSSSTRAAKTAGIGRRHHALDRQMRAVDGKLQIAHRRGVAGQHMHVDAECVADHAARIAHAAFGIEREADGQRMDHLALGLQRLLGAGAEHALDVGLVGLVAAKIDGGEKASLFSRPAVMLTISESTVSPAMRSAASTERRMACSARSRSTMTPDFTPCDF
jgi:hypothetical protein